MKLVDQILPATVDLRLVAGQDAGNGQVSVGGVVQPARWVDSARTTPGDDVQILFLDYPTAQSIALVIGRSGQPRPDVGSVTAVGTETLTVDAGEPVEATFLSSYSPVVGDTVRLLWNGQDVTVLGKVGTYVRPAKEDVEEGTRPPPPPKDKGTSTYAASDSASWSGGLYRWNSYYKSDVYQGSWGGISANGAWFYHGKPTRLSDKKIERIRLRLPPRLNAGYYNNGGQLHVFLHTSERRNRNSDVNRDWSTDIFIPAGYDGGLEDLPIGWADKITKQGYGIGIAGMPYMGFAGVNRRANSGALTFDWRG